MTNSKHIKYPCKDCGGKLQIRAYDVICTQCFSITKDGVQDAQIMFASDKQPKYILVPTNLEVQRKDLTICFANAIAQRLFEAGEKHSNKNIFSKDLFNADFCREKMLEAMSEGDPIDVVIYCAFLWWNDAQTFKYKVKETQAKWVFINETFETKIISIADLFNKFANGEYSHDDINGKMFWANMADNIYYTKPIKLTDPVPTSATHVVVSF